MSNDTDLIRQEIWASLADKTRREAFVASHLSNNTGSQIFALREARGWSQDKFAAEVGMAQPRISVLEAGCDCSLRTLKRIAATYDVALIVRFVPFSELVDWIAGLSEDQLAPVDFANDQLPGKPLKSTTTPHDWSSDNPEFPRSRPQERKQFEARELWRLERPESEKQTRRPNPAVLRERACIRFLTRKGNQGDRRLMGGQ